MSNILANVPPQEITLVRRKDGRITGERIAFTGDGSSPSLRSQGKALGLKGTALNEWFTAMASGDAAKAARIKARVLFNGALDMGMVPIDCLKKTNGNMVFSLIPEAKPAKTKTIQCVDPLALIASMTTEQKAAMLAALQA
jgi:hypothetical protein